MTSDIFSQLSQQAKGPSEPESAPPELHVCVRHGSLGYSPHPVVVGHYQHGIIESAERFLDHMLDHALSNRWDEGDYPARVGQSHVELRPLNKWRDTPPGAVVIGLGVREEFSGQVLRAAMYAGAAKYALRMCARVERLSKAEQDAFRSPEGWVDVKLSSLLVGSVNRAALSIESVVTALVEGVLLANQRLRTLGRWDCVRITELQFIEMYEDRAVQAQRAVKAMSSAVPSDHQVEALVPGRTLLRGEGAHHSRLETDFGSGQWQTIGIRRVPPPADETQSGFTWLEYSFNGNRAGVTDRRRPYSASVPGDIDDMVLSKKKKTKYLAREINHIFHALVPREMKETLVAGQHLMLRVDETAAAVPWELLSDHREVSGEEDPLRRPPAVSVSMVRRFAAEDHDRLERDFSRALNVLVVGDPIPHGRFRPLANAKREAEHVAKMFADRKFDVNAVVQQPGRIVRRELQTKEYGVIHIAAHGHYEDDGAGGGVVLDDGYLNTLHLDGLDAAPGLVFLNCCLLGAQDRDPAEAVRRGRTVSLNLAKHLVQMGCRAVVACGWEVSDTPAKVWANTFYQEMLEGHTFAEALLRARRKTFEEHQSNNTWAAYQAYGDPDFKLHTPRVAQDVEIDTDQILSERELSDAIDLVSRQGKREQKVENLTTLSAFATEHDLARSNILAQLGHAFAKSKAWAQAETALRGALAGNQSEAPLRTAETLARCLSEQGTQHMRSAKTEDERQAAHAYFQDAAEVLDRLLGLAPTAERWALRGSVSKRRAEVEAERLHEAGATAPSLFLLEQLAQAVHAYDAAMSAQAHANTYEPMIVVTLSSMLLRCMDNLPLPQVLAGELTRPGLSESDSAAASLGLRLASLKTQLPEADVPGQRLALIDRLVAERGPPANVWDRLVEPDLVCLKVFTGADPADLHAETDPEARHADLPNAVADRYRTALFDDLTCNAALSAARQIRFLGGLATLIPGQERVVSTLDAILDVLGKQPRAKRDAEQLAPLPTLADAVQGRATTPQPTGAAPQYDKWLESALREELGRVDPDLDKAELKSMRKAALVGELRTRWGA